MADELAAPPAGGAGAAGLRRLASLLAVPDYRAVWAAGTVGSLIHFTEFLVLGVFVQQQTGSPFLVALMLFAFALPNSLLGAVTGAVAERMDRRTLLLVCLGTMAVVTAAMAVVALLGALELWMVGIAAFLAGVCWTTEYPVRRTLLGEVAGRGRAAAGLSFDIATGTAMVFVGPLLGGLLLRDVGIHGFYMAASVAYVVECSDPDHAGHLSVEQQAAIVASARGLSGDNRDYLASTVRHIHALGLTDRRLEAVLHVLGERF